MKFLYWVGLMMVALLLANPQATRAADPGGQGTHGDLAEKNNPHQEKESSAPGAVESGNSLPHNNHGSHGRLSEEANPHYRQHSMRTLPETMLQRGELALAAGLSLQPLPIDLGNFYAGNLQTALISTSLQLGMMGWGMVLVAENNNWNMHGNQSALDSNWSRGEKNLLYGIIGGYVVSKLLSTWLAVDTLTDEQASVALLPSSSGASVQLAWQLQ